MTRPCAGVVARIARWSVAHRIVVCTAWLLLLVTATGAATQVGARYATNLSLPGTDSQHAADLLHRDFPAQAGDTDQIVMHFPLGQVADPQVRGRLELMLAQVAHQPHVTGVTSPFSPGSQAIARDGHTAFATIMFDQSAADLPKAAVTRVITTAQAVRSPDLQIELGGPAIQQAQQPSLGAATTIGLAAAIVVLLITFGSLLAMGLPIITALLGLGTGVGLGLLATRIVDTVDFSTELGVMIGLGVGIDYALFILTRFRQAYRDTADVDASITTAMDTAGRAVLFAGSTVIVALLGLVLLGVSLLYGLAVAAAIAVLCTMIASLTMLPVLLSWFGARLGAPRRRRTASAQRVGAWSRWAGLIGRHPWTALVGALAVLLVLAAPALSMRLGSSDAGNDPTSLTTRRAYDLLADGFGAGFNGPLIVVAQPADARTTARIAAALRQAPGVAQVSPPAIGPQGRTVTYQLFPRSAPQDAATTDLVRDLRDNRLPPIAESTGSRILVGGATATGIDFADVLRDKLPLFIAVVVAVSAVLLLVVFRSLLIPLQAAAMNLLSIGSSLGVVVAVFQHGWLGGLIGVTPGPIDAFIPVMLFAIVFGLSMDYEVFLVSRIHEEWQRRRDPTPAIIEGLGSTGRVITAAATIMICVFLSFVIGDNRGIKLFGLSLATAVFLDAFVIRSLLLPAVLHLFGRATWWGPGRRAASEQR